MDEFLSGGEQAETSFAGGDDLLGAADAQVSAEPAADVFAASGAVGADEGFFGADLGSPPPDLSH